MGIQSSARVKSLALLTFGTNLRYLKQKNNLFFACFFNAWMSRVDFQKKKLTFLF